MKQVYLDNGATSPPQGPGVGEAVKHFIDDIGSNQQERLCRPGCRGDCVRNKERLCRLFNFGHPENVIFTLNVTQGLIFLKVFAAGDHCIVSSMEHNAVMRP